MDVNVRRRGTLASPRRAHRPREWLTALIKEARQRARRRRLRVGAGLLAAALVAFGAAFGGGFNNGGGGGGGAKPASEPSLPAEATSASGPAANGPITLLASRHVPYGDEEIAAVGAFGATAPVFRCSAINDCRELTAFAWSPNGRWLAIGADTVSVRSDYNGLHLHNLATGRDILLARQHILELSWSRDGSKLAYAARFPTGPGGIYIRDLTAREPAKLLKTGTEGQDAFPSWSPDGRRIAFATKFRAGEWSVSTIGMDGHHRRFLATGSSPAWSPDGRLIAYRGSCGRIRLMTPVGQGLVPAHAGRGPCAEIGVAGAPVWSPDGRQIAMATLSGTYVMDRTGGHLQLVTPEQGRSVWGSGLPAWRPVPKR